MGKRFIVHSRHDTTVPVEAEAAGGHKITGAMPASIVELVPQDGVGPSITLTEFTPTEAAQERVYETFTVGGVVEMGAFVAVKE